MARTNVFLSGWEYNRLLHAEVTTPLQSALPGRVLWTGALQFWLFDKTYCTQESLDAEITAHNTLGWATGRIFAELADMGWLVPIRWSEWSTQKPAFADELRLCHKALSERHGGNVRALLAAGRWDELDALKAALLAPILVERECFLDIGPNSLDRWFPENAPEPVTAAVGRAIAEPLFRNTLTVCRPPGEGLPDYVLKEQHSVEMQHEKPMIPALLAADLPQVEYLARLSPYATAYDPANRQLLAEWRVNRLHLHDLRAYAQETIWSPLHGGWLPRAERDPTFIPQMRELVREAVLRAKFPFIDSAVDWGVRLASAAAGYAVGLALNIAGVPVPPGVTALAAEAPGEVMVDAVRRRRLASDELKLFYQRALRGHS